jgi:hypothetical protein
MMLANRFPFSFRALLLFITLVAASSAALGGTLDDAAGKLAAEIGSRMPAGTKARCEFANLSSLAPEEAAQLERSLRGALRPWCVDESVADAADIRVTLSENWKEFVYAAQIRTTAGAIVLLETSPRMPRSNGAAGAMPLTLRAEKVWEGPQRLLDFTALKSQSGAEEYWLLTEEGVVLRLVGRTIVSQLQLSRTAPASRDLQGALTQAAQGVQATFAGKTCTISPDAFRVTECHPTSPEEGNGAAGSAPDRNVRQRGSQSPFVEGACPFVRPILASGGGDYTEKDLVQLFDGSDSPANFPGTPVSTPIFLSGPVLKISGTGDLGIVVHNLDSENYEAYRVYISCAR